MTAKAFSLTMETTPHIIKCIPPSKIEICRKTNTSITSISHRMSINLWKNSQTATIKKSILSGNYSPCLSIIKACRFHNMANLSKGKLMTKPMKRH